MTESTMSVQSLIDAHYESLYRYAYRLSGRATDADDLTQDTFSKALTQLPQLRNPERVKSWLFSILRNAYLHRIRDEKRHRFHSLETVGDIAGEEVELPTDVDPKVLQSALNELDEVFRTPLILFYFDDFSYRDIAEQMDLPIGTVMSRLARAKGYLRTRLAPHYEPADPRGVST